MADAISNIKTNNGTYQLIDTVTVGDAFTHQLIDTVTVE